MWNVQRHLEQIGNEKIETKLSICSQLINRRSWDRNQVRVHLKKSTVTAIIWFNNKQNIDKNIVLWWFFMSESSEKKIDNLSFWIWNLCIVVHYFFKFLFGIQIRFNDRISLIVELLHSPSKSLLLAKQDILWREYFKFLASITPLMSSGGRILSNIKGGMMKGAGALGRGNVSC